MDYIGRPVGSLGRIEHRKRGLAIIEKDPPGIEPMSLIPREDRERREELDREKSPSPEKKAREVRMNDDRDRSEDGSEEREDDRRRRRFKYEETSSDSELNSLNQVESSKTALNVVWATVDSGAATSCLPVEMCQEKGLEVERTSATLATAKVISWSAAFFTVVSMMYVQKKLGSEPKMTMRELHRTPTKTSAGKI